MRLTIAILIAILIGDLVAAPAFAGERPRGERQDAFGEVARLCGEPDAEATIILKACTTLIESDAVPPQDVAAALVDRGLAYERQGDETRAMADFDRALQVFPGNVTARLNRGSVYRVRGDIAAAIREYEAVLARDPMNAMALNNRCYARAMTGEGLDQALADCDASLRLAKNDPHALDSRGFAHLVRGDDAEALNDFEAVLRLDPGSAHALYGRGLARIDLGDERAGQEDVRKALRRRADVAADYDRVGLRPDAAAEAVAPVTGTNAHPSESPEAAAKLSEPQALR